jgi:hypothetical protein
LLAFIAALALAQSSPLPVTDVTVFSDRARVTRSGTLAVSGDKKVELAVLLDTVEASSVNVTVSGAELLAVELSRLEDEQLPVGEARTLLTALEDNGDAFSRVQHEQVALADEERALASLAPQVPQVDPLKPAPKLNASGWTAAASFAADQLGRVQARGRELALKAQDLTDKRSELTTRAQLLGGAQRRSGLRVVASVRGNGPARFAVTYVAINARWFPTYDVQLQPDTGKVQVAFAGLVSQETGEDWSDAALTLSTAVPSAAVEFPTLLTWKIGTKERFIPTPAAVSEWVVPPPPVPPLPTMPREADLLRMSLAQVVNAPVGNAQVPPPEKAIAGKLRQDQKDQKGKKEYKKTTEYSFDGDTIEGDLSMPEPVPRPGAAPRAMPRRNSFAEEQPAPAPEAESISVTSAPSSYHESPPRFRTTGFSLSPPPAYERPQFAADLPAAAAGGYDLSWPSLQKETVQSGKGARRVALFTQSWPVTTERKLYPALFPESFLTAELKNPAAWPLPAGAAHLYVGADPAGTAKLKLVSPGETFTLPLGIDRALKPVRNVRVVDAERGVISKDDVSEYTVSIQLANPYRAPVAVRLYDQIPVTSDKEVEVKLLETKPAANVDSVRGHLEWRMSLAAGQKSEVSFRYTLKRPKGWKMNQWEVAP